MNGKKSTAGNSVLSVFTGNTGIIGVLVILCVVVALATDKFLTPSNIISVLRQISINTYIALGMTLIIILGHIDLAVGAIVAMSGTLTVGFVVNQGLPIGVAIAAGIIIGVVAGLIDGMVVSKFRVPAFIITMAMMNVCNGIGRIQTTYVFHYAVLVSYSIDGSFIAITRFQISCDYFTLVGFQHDIAITINHFIYGIINDILIVRIISAAVRFNQRID